MTQDQVPFSPIALVGTLALLAAYLVAAWAFAAGIAGNARKSRRLVNASVYGLYGFGALIALASTLMIYAFVTHEFSIKYVASTSDVAMPMTYKITSFWGGLDGSLLFWVLVLSIFSTIAITVNAKKHREMIGYVVATIMAVQFFFLSLLLFTKNPFATYLTAPPTDGQGLNPLLQNYWMVIHPPSLYTGFVAATIPFAFGIGALASGRLDDMWLKSVRSWMLICFGFLSLGLILGGRWAYEELGWGGYWAWDPVENAGLIPWFTATAFLHSAIIQEQRGTMKMWNLCLVIITFFLTIFGTFMTRSGAVQSVHAFGEDNVLALQFIVFMAVILIVSIGLLVYRSNKLSSRAVFDSFASREFAFLINNWILLACAFFVLFATMFPTISEAINGERISVGPEFFNKWMTPFGLLLLFLAGAAPLLAWRKTTRERLISQFMFPTITAAVTIVLLVVIFPQTKHLSAMFAAPIRLPVSLINFGLVAFVAASIGQEFYRGIIVRKRQTGSDAFTSLIGLLLVKRRKYGGYIVHLGVAIMFFGFAGKAYERMVDRTVEKPGVAAKDGTGSSSFGFGTFTGPFSTSDYYFSYENLFHTSDDHKDAITAQVGIYDKGNYIDTVYPAKWDFHKGDQQTTEVAIHVRTLEDVYVVLTGYDLDTSLANFRVYINPLILWVWLGFVVLAAGTLLCLVPESLVQRPANWKPTSKLGRAADAGIMILLVGGALVGLASQARAGVPKNLNLAAESSAATEHVPAGMGMGKAGGGYAAMNRPTNDTEAKAMKELLCPCGCARQSIHDCDCATAANLRAKVQAIMAGSDLKTDAGRKQAYDATLAVFVKDYGKQTLATPESSASWAFPAIAAVGALALLLVVGRRWVKSLARAGRWQQRQQVAVRRGGRRRGVQRQVGRRAFGNRLMAAKKPAKAVEPSAEDALDDDELPKAQVVERDKPAPEDPYRRLKIAGFVFLLLCGWAFVLGTNRFHITAPVVFACLAYTALMTAIVNLWRTGASAAGPDSIDSEWGRPLGARGELEKEKKTLLKGIKEAEFDAATNKLSKADADTLIAEYRARAIEVIKEIDRLEAGAALSPKEQIAREVKARVELGKVADKPSPKAEKAKAKKADAKSTSTDAKPADEATDASDAGPTLGEVLAANPHVGTRDADGKFIVAESAQADAESNGATSADVDAAANGKAADAKVATELNEAASAKIAAAEAKVAAARAAADAAEAKAAAARAEVEAAEAKAEAAKLASESSSKKSAGESA
ncbi:MAG: cytochrome c-type biogenesis CcmF C-terminal domain-containing protein [Kofleriaceae bacterium]